ncbi:hypothetical protein [Streptomyces sp. NPDC059916]|uniref:hypothetical protein n=1 Tax=Streptomyces sp. NPDC059916 TaxID=3347001 RepID=UPI00369EE78C
MVMFTGTPEEYEEQKRKAREFGERLVALLTEYDQQNPDSVMFAGGSLIISPGVRVKEGRNGGFEAISD